MENSLVIFTKVPVTGYSKTRLIKENGGELTAFEARIFYESCLLDVIECCLESLKQFNRFADLLICHDQDGERDYLIELMEENLEFGNIKYEVFSDQGGTFDDKMQFASDYCFQKGYKNVVIIGGDIPLLQPELLKRSFNLLNDINRGKGSIVTAPSQEGGFSLVGINKEVNFNFDQVFYNEYGITAMDMLLNKSQDASIPLAVLDVLFDVDIMEDLGTVIPILKMYSYAANFQDLFVSRRTMSFLEEKEIDSFALPEDL